MKRILAATTIAAALLAHASSAHAVDPALLAGALRTAENAGIIAVNRVYKKTCPVPMPAHLTRLYDDIVKEGDYDNAFVAKMTKKFEGEVKAQGVAKWCRSLAEMLPKG